MRQRNKQKSNGSYMFFCGWNFKAHSMSFIPGWSPRDNQCWTEQLQLWFSMNQCSSKQKNSALLWRESALNQRCSALIFLAAKHWVFSREKHWFSCDLLWIISDIINTCRWEYQIVMTQSEVMKSLEVVIKLLFLVFKKYELPQYLVKWQQKLKFFEIILKVHPAKRENTFEKLNHISFITWADFPVFVTSLSHQKIKHLIFCCSLLVANLAEILNYARQNCCTSKIFEKKEKLTKNCHSEYVKNQHCIWGNQCCSALSQRCSAVNQRCLRDLWEWWTTLKQSWNYFESELISAECLWDVNPGWQVKPGTTTFNPTEDFNFPNLSDKTVFFSIRVEVMQ